MVDAYYCSETCQQFHWKVHGKHCCPEGEIPAYPPSMKPLYKTKKTRVPNFSVIKEQSPSGLSRSLPRQPQQSYYNAPVVGDGPVPVSARRHPAQSSYMERPVQPPHISNHSTHSAIDQYAPRHYPSEYERDYRSRGMYRGRGGYRHHQRGGYSNRGRHSHYRGGHGGYSQYNGRDYEGYNSYRQPEAGSGYGDNGNYGNYGNYGNRSRREYDQFFNKNFRTKPCRFYFSGKTCLKGEQCNFSHDERLRLQGTRSAPSEEYVFPSYIPDMDSI